MLVAYGLRFGFDGDAESADVSVLPPEMGEDRLEAVWTGPRDPVVAGLRWVDGREIRVERGREDDRLFSWGDSGRWLVDPAATRLRGWSPDAPPSPRWWRVLFDFVMASVALSRGNEALHAGAVLVDGRAVAIAAGQGGGKTSLLSELVRRGYPLIADDVLFIEADGAAVLCHPAPPLMNVPLATPHPGVVGHVLAEIDDEAWVLAREHVTGPVPFGAMFVLERRDGAGLNVEPVPGSTPVVASHALDSGAVAERRRARFDVLSDVADHVAIHSLSAPLDGAPPPVLADAVLEALE
jgi:hypothetical protein